MAFINLDDAAEQLGVNKDRLNELREAGQLRAYRDGSSWKFRSEEIDKLQETGLPSLSADSAIGSFGAGLLADDDDGSGTLSLDVESSDAGASPSSAKNNAASKSDDLELGDLEIGDDVGGSIELSEEDELEGPSRSDADLSVVDEPTVAADEPPETLEEGSDLVLDVDGSGDDAESILLSEAELGDSPARPPSTIIGKSELGLDDEDDLQIPGSDPKIGPAGLSDVQLVEEEDAEEVFSGEAAGSEVIPGAGAPPSGKFEDLEELEIDLEAESSRILEAEDVAAAQAAQKQAEAPQPSGESDLELAPSDSDAGLAGLSSLDAEDGSKASEINLAGISSLQSDEGASAGNLSGFSSIELAEDEDDDFVLGDSGSDITLAGGDSGINLMPSDSGLALEEASQILGGSAMGSSIDLGEISSIGSGASSQAMGSAELSSTEDFLLTPLGEDEADDDEDSSQIIALEAVEEDDDEAAMLGGDAMDLSGGEAAGLAATSTGALVAPDSEFSVWNVVGLGSCLTLMAMCGVMMIDVIRNMWAFEEPFALNSSLIDGLLGIFGK